LDVAQETPLENSVIHHTIAHQPCDVAILKSDKGRADSFERILIQIGGKDINDSLTVRFVHIIYRDIGCQVTLMTIIPTGATRIQRKRAADLLQEQSKYTIFTKLNC